MLPAMGEMSERLGHEHEVRPPIRAPATPTAAGRRDTSERLAAGVGNRAFAALVARSGAGIMADGTVHPDIRAAIARVQGAGAPLEPLTRDRFALQLGDRLADVRVHTDAGADALAHAVAARAFTTGSDVFFATGEYRPGSAGGDRLLAHELAHVVQQRGAPNSGPLVVSQPGDALEREADAVARELAG
jgi:hypothetical protein